MPNTRLLQKAQVDVYASVLVDVLQSAEAAFAGYKELISAKATIRSHHKLRDALVSASLPASAKAQLVHSIFDESFSSSVVSVLAAMAERGELELLARVCDRTLELAQEKYESVFAHVVTAVALDDPLRATICEQLSQKYGKAVVLDETVDPSILGGIIISAQGRRLDASIASQLTHARAVLSSNVSRGGEH